MTERRSIGIDRRIDLEWLDAIAGQVAKGAEEPAIREAIFALLEGVVTGGNKRGTACHKTMSVLSRTWVNVSSETRAIRDRAAHLLPQLTRASRLGLHWALFTATYPFFADVATNTGRLLVLQGNLTLAQLTRRMREEWGDRSTMTRAVQRVIRSMVQWGVLADSDQRGVYAGAKEPISVPATVGELLLEALLMRHDGESLPVEQALRHPCFFPFRVELLAHQLRRSPRFDVHRQGLDVDVVTLVLPDIQESIQTSKAPPKAGPSGSRRLTPHGGSRR
jgi:hypothetical protein